MPSSFRTLVEWTSFGTELNPLKRWNPFRPLICWYSARIVDTYIHTELEKRFAEHIASQSDGSAGDNTRSNRVKSVVALALENYIAEYQATKDEILHCKSLDPVFKKAATAQLRLFMIAGHDTTSSTMAYTYYLLYSNPECLLRIRDEHDSVFGTDISKAGQLLTKDPSLLNRLPYTTAVMKETLRLYPPASSMRIGGIDTVLTDEDGQQYPTANCNIWALHLAIHRNPEFWPQADKFIPDRWLVGPDDTLYPVKGGWRPFEFGPRNCIGQTLATTEIKVLLALTVREFDISHAYDEWDKLYPSGGIKTAMGDRAYQVEGGGGGSHPANKFPCRIVVR